MGGYHVITSKQINRHTYCNILLCAIRLAPNIIKTNKITNMKTGTQIPRIQVQNPQNKSTKQKLKMRL